MALTVQERRFFLPPRCLSITGRLHELRIPQADSLVLSSEGAYLMGTERKTRPLAGAFQAGAARPTKIYDIKINS